MLNDIPYKNILKYERRYEIWRLHDVDNNSFAKIAKKYGLSVDTITSDYYKILSLKLNYYVNHLSIVHGHIDTTYFKKISLKAYECYRGMKYVLAYFEKEYAAILSEYRNGEPGLPEQFLLDLPPLREGFRKRTISSLIYLRETKGMTYSAIGKRLRLTKEKVTDLYNHHYHVLYCQLLEKLIEITGDASLNNDHWDTYQLKNVKKKYDDLINEYPELCNNILETLKK